jgi:hypothetical protein
MDGDVISVDLPMTFKLRGGRKVILLPDGTQGNPAPMATIDNTMIKAIARAFRWQKLLENGTYGCLEEIARAVALRCAIEAELSGAKPNLQRLDHLREELDYVTLRLYRNRKKVILDPDPLQTVTPSREKRPLSKCNSRSRLLTTD